MALVLFDAGPLTALLNPNDEFHIWARDMMQRLPLATFTREAHQLEAPPRQKALRKIQASERNLLALPHKPRPA